MEEVLTIAFEAVQQMEASSSGVCLAVLGMARKW